MRFNFNTSTFEDLNLLQDKLAIIGTDRSLTWQQFFDASQKLQELLQYLPDSHPVIIYGEKEANFPVAMATLIRLNIVYVPVDAIMPSERVKRIVEMTGAKIIINCSSRPVPVLMDFVIDTNLNLVKGELLKQQSESIRPSDPVRYILFTSGSTGEPKGVQITRAALNDFVNWYSTWPQVKTDSIFMNQAPFSFDVSLCDFIGALHLGATMVLNDYRILKDADMFLKRLDTYKANVMVCTPSFIYMYSSSPHFNTMNYPELRNFIFMGEELTTSMVKKLKKAFPLSGIINAYGPTEATVVVTYIEITDELILQHPISVPIGYIKPNHEMLVLNDSGSKEEVGELVIVGDSVSVGYWNDKSKSEAAFYVHGAKRAYRTGDQGYIKNDVIYFLGRNDNQIKLNGYRIELDEITEILLRQENIQQAITVSMKSGATVKKIISFVTIKSGDISVDNLKLDMAKHLPAYMIPSEIVVLQEFPMNSNYKTDKKALIEYYLNL